MKVICRFMAFEPKTTGKAKKLSKGKMAVLELDQNGGTRQLTIYSPHDIALATGDKVRCLAGGAVVLVNPTTQAGAFLLTPELPADAPWNHRTELEINEETTKIRPRGKIVFKEDIGGIRGGTASIR